VRRDAGLTLIEILVASVVMLLIVMAVYQVMDWAHRN